MLRGSNLNPNDIHQSYHVDDEIEPPNFLYAQLTETSYYDPSVKKDILGIVSINALKPGTLTTLETRLYVEKVSTWIARDPVGEVKLELECRIVQ